MRHTIYRISNGEILRQFQGASDDAQAQLAAGEGVVVGAGTWMTHRVVNGALVALDQPRVKPSRHAVWSPEAAAWVDPRSLAQAKAARWADMKEVRATKLNSGTFTCAGKVYDCNREAISMAANSAMLAKAALDLTWSKVWVLADNTTTTLNADQMLLVAKACDDYINAQWTTGRSLRAQINAATTIAAVDAINWP